MITPRELVDEMIRLSRELDSAHDRLVSKSEEWAQLENDYRLAKATAFLAATGRTVEEKKAHADQATSQQRVKAHAAEGLKVAALEKVRSLRAQLSALQSVSSSVRSEIEMAGRT